MFIFSDEKFSTPFFGEDDGSDVGNNAKDDVADQPSEKTFTQSELEEIIAKRLERERKKYTDYDDLKAKLSEYEKAEEERKKAEMSEQERLEAERAEALRRVEEAETKSAEALKKANERLIRAEFRVLAKDAGIRADALDDAFKLADFSEVEVGDDGSVSGVDAVIKSLKESKPWLSETQKQDVPRTVGNPSGGGDLDDEVKR